MTFLFRMDVPLNQAHLLDTWRDRELLVQTRWDDFLAADRASRSGAFAAYVAALYAEAAAADELAHSHLAEAA
jgi:hypothetical protein